ncbi:MAG: hypothetical protein QOJ98_1293 [Acidobacteriota bacterium]|nr:hypothetical protein [Acidobacteriota bacterium]
MKGMPTRTIKTPVNTIKTSVNTIKTFVDTIKSSGDTIKSSGDTIKSSVDTIKSSVDTIKTFVDTIKSSVDTISCVAAVSLTSFATSEASGAYYEKKSFTFSKTPFSPGGISPSIVARRSRSSRCSSLIEVGMRTTVWT